MFDGTTTMQKFAGRPGWRSPALLLRAKVPSTVGEAQAGFAVIDVLVDSHSIHGQSDVKSCALIGGVKGHGAEVFGYNALNSVET